MQNIISPKNIKRLLKSKKFRDQRNLYVAEGDRWLREAIKSQSHIETIFVTNEWMDKNRKINISQYPHQIININEMRSLADTVTPSGAIAVIKKKTLEFPNKPNLVLILDSIKDPGNMGTLIRTSTAVGVDALILSPQCVDIYNPKVVRSTMGSILRLPIIKEDWDSIHNRVKDLQIFAADMGRSKAYSQVNWSQPSALIIGSEAHGLSQEAKEITSQVISIPIKDNTESLNAAVAASVILFEAQRQRTN